jgi:hypothetical protein
MAKASITQTEFDGEVEKIVDNSQTLSGGRLLVDIGGKSETVDGHDISTAKREIATLLLKVCSIKRGDEKVALAKA